MLGLGPGSRSKAPAHPTGPLNGKPLSDKDFTSGNCMTCGALSRWPKGLRVFKCTLCVTINDLVDLRGVIESQNQSSGGARSNGSPGEAGRKGEYRALSLVQKNALVGLTSLKQVQSHSRSRNALLEIA